MQYNETGREGRNGVNSYDSLNSGYMQAVYAQILGTAAAVYTPSTRGPRPSSRPSRRMRRCRWPLSSPAATKTWDCFLAIPMSLPGTIAIRRAQPTEHSLLSTRGGLTTPAPSPGGDASLLPLVCRGRRVVIGCREYLDLGRVRSREISQATRAAILATISLPAHTPDAALVADIASRANALTPCPSPGGRGEPYADSADADNFPGAHFRIVDTVFSRGNLP